jgi:lipid-A-disaccharide synthase
LAASLIRALRELRPDASFIGVAGPRMQAAGCATLVDQERLAVMGLVAVLRHLPEVLRLRRQLGDYFLAQPPDLFVGVDAPDFNLTLERRLRRAGIPTAHLVSPTVWAWRPGRVKGLRRAVDLVLSIFPFEEPFLRERGVPVRYIGHPLADDIPLEPDRAAARQALGLPPAGPVIALLPGSRASEVGLLARPFLETAAWCLARRPDLRLVVPLVSPRLRGLFEKILVESGLEARFALTAPATATALTLVDGQGREAMTAADLVLSASGTATLEALLLQRPLVVGYRVDPLTYWLVKTLKLIKVPHVAMANLLAGEELAPEFLQDRCRAELMGPALLALLTDEPRLVEIRETYAGIHRQLRRDAGRQAAQALLELAAAP